MIFPRLCQEQGPYVWCCDRSRRFWTEGTGKYEIIQGARTNLWGRSLRSAQSVVITPFEASECPAPMYFNAILSPFHSELKIGQRVTTTASVSPCLSPRGVITFLPVARTLNVYADPRVGIVMFSLFHPFTLFLQIHVPNSTGH